MMWALRLQRYDLLPGPLPGDAEQLDHLQRMVAAWGLV